MSDIERRSFPLHTPVGGNGGISHRRLSGIAMRYGTVGYAEHGAEVFLPGSLGPVDDLDIVLTFSHDDNRPLARSRGGGLLLTESTSMLSAQATLPPTRECDDTLTLIKQNIIQGLSIEFVAQVTSRNADGIRLVERAELRGISCVTRPAFPASTVEARATLSGSQRLATLRSSIPARRRLDCRCRRDCDSAEFEENALDDLVELSEPRPQGPLLDFEPTPAPRPTLVFEPQPPPGPTFFQPPPAPAAPAVPTPRPTPPARPPARPPATTKRDILAVKNSYESPIGSTNEGSLRAWSDGAGGVELAIDVPNTSFGISLLEAAKTVSIFARPVLDIDLSDATVIDGVARYKRGYIRAVTIGATDNSTGWTAMYLQTDPEDDAPIQEQRSLDRWERTGRRIWL